MTIKAVLFDLDGTLADTALDLGGALNDFLREQGLPEKDLSAIRPFVVHGSMALLKFGMGEHAVRSDADWLNYQQRYLDIYESRLARDTVLFSDVNQVLVALKKYDIRWGVVTNKHARFTDKLLMKLYFPIRPDVVVSGDSCVESKPSPMPLLYACEQLGVLPEQCVYVGDALCDIQAGKSAGMKTVLAKWGYIGEYDCPAAWEADWMAENMLDMMFFLKNWL